MFRKLENSKFRSSQFLNSKHSNKTNGYDTVRSFEVVAVARHISCSALSLILIYLIAGVVLALRVSAQPTLPPSTDPSRVQQRFDTVPTPADNPPTLPEIRGAQTEAPSDLGASVTFTLHEIRLEGDSVLPLDPWREYSKQYIGRSVNGNDIFELARRLTSLYRDDGYILSQVIVPTQSLADGVLTLRVVEGYIAEVHIDGDPVAHDMLEKIGARIKASRPLRARDLERYLLLGNDLPGVSLRSVLTPSLTPGAADLTLIAQLRKVEGNALPTLDNYGSRYLGPNQLSAWTTINQVFNGNDELQANAMSADNSELGYWKLGYGRVVNVEGLRIDANVSRARTRPGQSLEEFEVRGRADAVSLSLSYPLLRRSSHNLRMRLAYDHRDVETDVLGELVIEDRIRALRLGTTWTVFDAAGGNNQFDLEVSRGIGGTEADDLLKSRADADGKFTKFIAGYQRFQTFGTHVGLTVGIAGQWTDEPLLSSEQYSLGGRLFGRAYEPAELVGDRALAFRAEPFFTVRNDGDWLRTTQWYGFYDVGRVWNEPSGGASATRGSLASAGLGARLLLAKNITLTLEAAQPLTKPVTGYEADDEGDDVRFLGSFQVFF